MEKSRLIYILLALFVGTLGIHNFYAGYTKKGVAQLLMTFPGCLLFGIPTIIAWIWSLVNIVTITKDANGTPFK